MRDQRILDCADLGLERSDVQLYSDNDHSCMSEDLEKDPLLLSSLSPPPPPLTRGHCESWSRRAPMPRRQEETD